MRRWCLTLMVLWALMASSQTVQGTAVGAADSVEAAADTVVTAEDLCFTTLQGATRWLHELPADRLTLLVLYDPDCRNCRQLLFALRHSTVVSQRVGEQLLQVVTVDVGTNRHETLAVQRELPASWVKGTLLSDLTDSRLYDTSAVPMLYLMDADRRVMLADDDVQMLNTLLSKLW